MALAYYIRRLLTPQQRRRIKKSIRKLKIALDPNVKKIGLEDMRRLLIEDFSIKSGDAIFVTSSFGNLCAADFSPRDLIELLMDIVEKNGAIMMPFYPPLNSSAWARSGESFDMCHTKSSMGVVTNVFASMPGVVKSKHPTKAVCAWGRDAENLCAGHEFTMPTPFSYASPYGKFLTLKNSKSVALGIGRMPMFHCVEDVLSDTPEALYEPDIYPLIVHSGETDIIVDTRIHRDDLMSSAITSVKFLLKYGCPTFMRRRVGTDYCYCVNNTAMKEFCLAQFSQGITRFNAK